jgi:hypothetical protein
MQYANLCASGRALAALSEAIRTEAGADQLDRLDFVLSLLDQARSRYELTDEQENELFHYACTTLCELRQPLIKKHYSQSEAEAASREMFTKDFWQLVSARIKAGLCASAPLFQDLTEAPKAGKREEIKAQLQQCKQQLQRLGKPLNSTQQMVASALYKELERLTIKLNHCPATTTVQVLQESLF